MVVAHDPNRNTEEQDGKPNSSAITQQALKRAYSRRHPTHISDTTASAFSWAKKNPDSRVGVFVWSGLRFC